MNEEIISSIENKKSKALEQENEKEESVTWLVFSMNSKKYAIESTQVQELIRDVEVYSLPFVPNYIEGVINRRGEPCTVINPEILLELEKIDGQQNLPVPLFLVLNIPDDQVCIHIENIMFFYETSKRDLRIYRDSSSEFSFYKGIVEQNHEEIPVLNPEAFELRLRKDLVNA